MGLALTPFALTHVSFVNAPIRITSIGRNMKKSMNIPTLVGQLVTGMLRRSVSSVLIVEYSIRMKSISDYMESRSVTSKIKDGRRLSST